MTPLDLKSIEERLEKFAHAMSTVIQTADEMDKQEDDRQNFWKHAPDDILALLTTVREGRKEVIEEVKKEILTTEIINAHDSQECEIIGCLECPWIDGWNNGKRDILSIIDSLTQ